MTRDEITIKALYDLTHTLAAPLLERFRYPWEVLEDLGGFLTELCRTLPKEEYLSPAEKVRVSTEAVIRPGATITGPCVICAGAEVG